MTGAPARVPFVFRVRDVDEGAVARLAAALRVRPVTARCLAARGHGDVEAARSEVFSALNSATALRHALEHASAASERIAETLSKLDVEFNDVRIESERLNADRSAMLDALKRAQQGLDSTRIARAARESELASARIEHEWRASQVRAREHELAGLGARLTSLEQLEAARAGFSDAARAVLANANGAVNQKGAVADYIEEPDAAALAWRAPDLPCFALTALPAPADAL